MASLQSVPKTPIEESGEVVSIASEREGNHRRVVEMAEQIAAIMRTEPDTNRALDAYSLARSFWCR